MRNPNHLESLKNQLALADFNPGQVKHTVKFIRQTMRQVFDGDKTGRKQTDQTIARLQEKLEARFPALSGREDIIQAATVFARDAWNVYRGIIRRAERNQEMRQIQEPNDQAQPSDSKRNNVRMLDPQSQNLTTMPSSSACKSPIAAVEGSSASKMREPISGGNLSYRRRRPSARAQPARDLSRKDSSQSPSAEYRSSPEPLDDKVELGHRDVANFLVSCEPSLSHRTKDIINLGLVNAEWLEAYARWPKEVRDSLIAKTANMTEAEKIVFDLEISKDF